MAAAISTPSIKIAPRTTMRISGKHLIFQFGSEEFAIDVMNVREIMKAQSITIVPQTPSFIQGVINLRGRIGIPILSHEHRLPKLTRSDVFHLV